MISHGLLASFSGVASHRSTCAVVGRSGTPRLSMFSSTYISANPAIATMETIPIRLLAIVPNDVHAMASVCRARIAGPNERATAGTAIGAVRSIPTAAGSGACAARRRPRRSRHPPAAWWAKRKRAWVSASAPAAIPTQRRRLTSSAPSSPTSRVRFSAGVHPTDRSLTMLMEPIASTSLPSSGRASGA
jgi:hypothetical protein